MTQKKRAYKGKKAPTRGQKRPEVSGNHGKHEKHRLNDSFDTVFGFHSVLEALKNPARKHRTLLATKNAERKLLDALPSLPINPAPVSAEEISKLTGEDAVHQGVLLQSVPLPEKHIDDIAGENLILILDQITDPHNIGAMMRSACAFGAKSMIMTDRHTPADNMTTSKAASGAREYVAPIRVTNLARTIEEVQRLGFIVIGLDSEADHDLSSPEARKIYQNTPTALVMGSEGKGLRRLTREKCDLLARINAPGPIVSLNVSNATALALYELTRQDTA